MAQDIGRFIQLDNLIRKIAHNLVDVENPDPKIAASAKNICKLLYYVERDPLKHPNSTTRTEPKPTFETLDEAHEHIMNKRVLLVPRVPAEDERSAFIVVIIDDFTLSSNKQFKPNRITFDILVHHDDWLLENSLRPFVIMQQIDNIFNEKKLSIGKVEFYSGRSIVLTPQMIGYSLVYSNVEFN
jgi:hypothetical protein